jgi:putative membrane protein
MDDRTKGEAPLKSEARDIKRSAKAVEESAGTLSGRAGELVDSSDRRTTLAGDRTLLAAERTYAAWVRTALASLAAGVGSTVLVKGVLPEMVGKVTGTVLVAFAAFCLVAAVWRELQGTPTTPRPDIKPLPRALLVPMNFLLLLVAVAALVGIWSA